MCLPKKLALAITCFGIGFLFLWQALVIENITDSLPRGVYIRNIFDASPDVGDIVKFRLPPNMRRYFENSDWWSAWFMQPQNGMLKVVVATNGDIACDNDGVFTVNGNAIVPIRYDMPNANDIPHIDGCIAIAYNEVLVATESERSIDSRYFGAIRVEECSVYVPLLTWQ